MKLFFVCNNIRGFDVQVKSLSGGFDREIYLPRGEHAAYMETMADLSHGFVMTMSDHIKDPENDYRVRTMALDAINYDFGEAKLGDRKLGDLVSKGETFAFNTEVESLPEEADSIYIRFVRMANGIHCVPEVVAMKAFGASKIVSCHPPQSHRLAVELPDDELSEDDERPHKQSKLAMENQSATDLKSNEHHNDEDEHDYAKDGVITKRYWILRVVTMVPAGILFLITAFVTMFAGLDGDPFIARTNFFDDIMYFVSQGVGWAVFGVVGLHLTFRPFMTPSFKPMLLKSVNGVIVSFVLSALLMATAATTIIYFKTEGNAFASGDEKQAIYDLDETLWDVIHEQVDPYDLQILEYGYPNGFYPVIDTILTDKKLPEDEIGYPDVDNDNMFVRMKFMAKGKYYSCDVWANADTIEDAEELILSRFGYIEGLLKEITGNKYTVKSIRKEMKARKDEILDWMERYCHYDFDISDTLSIHYDDRWWHEEGEEAEPDEEDEGLPRYSILIEVRDVFTV